MAAAHQTMSYSIKSVREYSSVDYTTYKPNEVGTFSISNTGDFINCNSATFPKLKKFRLPLNLNQGYNPNAVDESRETSFPQWEKVLKWIKGSTDGYDSVADVDVITQRGILKDIGYTNHNYFKNPWKFEACKYKAKLYIRKLDEEDSGSWNDWAKKNSYWGKKFEEYVMEQEADVKATYRILKGSIGKSNVLLSAEVDAMRNGQHLEVKTCFANKVNGKIPLAWFQSHLGKIDTLYYGFKDKQGRVSVQPKEFPMSQVPGGRYLNVEDANAMLGLAGDVIKWMYDTLEDENISWLLEYNGRQISLTKKNDSFLPQWYLDFIGGTGVTKEDHLVKQVEALTLEHPA